MRGGWHDAGGTGAVSLSGCGKISNFFVEDVVILGVRFVIIYVQKKDFWEKAVTCFRIQCLYRQRHPERNCRKGVSRKGKRGKI